jgi:hypothetical protein
MSRVTKDKKLKEVNKFAYLSSVITSTCGAEEDVKTHIQKASAVSAQFYQAWKARELSIAT